MNSQRATLKVPGLKVAVPLKADQLPAGLVPPEGQPAGEPVLELALEGAPVTVTARINGKNYRKMLKVIAEHGADHVVVVLQGTLKPGPGGTLTLESAGFQVTVKTPKPAE